jgi:hypothetical protein
VKYTSYHVVTKDNSCTEFHDTVVPSGDYVTWNWPGGLSRALSRFIKRPTLPFRSACRLGSGIAVRASPPFSVAFDVFRSFFLLRLRRWQAGAAQNCPYVIVVEWYFKGIVVPANVVIN